MIAKLYLIQFGALQFTVAEDINGNMLYKEWPGDTIYPADQGMWERLKVQIETPFSYHQKIDELDICATQMQQSTSTTTAHALTSQAFFPGMRLRLLKRPDSSRPNYFEHAWTIGGIYTITMSNNGSMVIQDSVGINHIADSRFDHCFEDLGYISKAVAKETEKGLANPKLEVEGCRCPFINLMIVHKEGCKG